MKIHEVISNHLSSLRKSGDKKGKTMLDLLNHFSNYNSYIVAACIVYLEEEGKIKSKIKAGKKYYIHAK